jgi:hypothetical protein
VVGPSVAAAARASPARASPARAGGFGQPVLGIGLLLAGLVVSASIEAGGLRRAAFAFALVWIGALVLTSWNHPAGKYSASALYLLVFGLFHGGLLFSVALRGEAGLVVPAGRDWVFGPELPAAVRLSLVGCTAYATVVFAIRLGRRPDPPTVRPALSRTNRVWLGAVGVAAEAVALLLLWLAFSSVGQLTVLESGYGAYRQAADGAVGYALLLIGLGSAFAVSGTRVQRRFGLALFGLFAIIALPLGLRGSVLFPLVILVVTEVRGGHRIRLGAAVPAAMAILCLISVIRQTRGDGVGALFHGRLYASPLDAVGEMGYSLYPTVVVQRWHADGEPPAHGATLVAVPLRLVERLTGWHGGPPSPDYRLFNVEVMDRVGPIGGSPIAEGYHNAGLPGVLLLMAAVGYALARLEQRRPTPSSDVLLVVGALPLILQVRQAFAPVPVQVLVGLGLYAVARCGSTASAVVDRRGR